MSKQTKDGGPAFPSSNDVRAGNIGTSGHPGLSLRDYFAAKAMHSILITHDNESNALISRWAYEQADAMIEAREYEAVDRAIRKYGDNSDL